MTCFNFNSFLMKWERKVWVSVWERLEYCLGAKIGEKKSWKAELSSTTLVYICAAITLKLTKATSHFDANKVQFELLFSPVLVP